MIKSDVTDAVVNTTSMKLLRNKVDVIQQELNLKRTDIEWKVLKRKISFPQKPYESFILLGENELGYVKMNPNEAGIEVGISSSIIKAPSLTDAITSPVIKYLNSENSFSESSENILTYAILYALAFIEAQGEHCKFKNTLKKYMKTFNLDDGE